MREWPHGTGTSKVAVLLLRAVYAGRIGLDIVSTRGVCAPCFAPEK